jgi:hypothetical protein
MNENCFSILHLFDSKKLIKKLCLINLLIVSSIPRSFKEYRIYLLDLKEHLFLLR